MCQKPISRKYMGVNFLRQPTPFLAGAYNRSNTRRVLSFQFY